MGSPENTSLKVRAVCGAVKSEGNRQCKCKCRREQRPLTDFADFVDYKHPKEEDTYSLKYKDVLPTRPGVRVQ